MEHIVQFAIGIDDNAIVKAVSENAEKEIIKCLQQQVTNILFRPKNYLKRDADPKIDPLSEFAQEIILEFFKENKDIIIENASKIIADKLARSKAYKAILENKEMINND